MTNLVHEGVNSNSTDREPQDPSLALSPRVDVLETENEFLVYADMPGTKPEDVDIRFEQGELTVHGRRANGKDDFAAYHRIFTVAESVAADKISAELKYGVLTIHLPKVEVVKPRRISVTG
jgi:HSP20 family protein